MKKTLAIIIAIAMVFALAACGKKAEQPLDNGQNANVTPVEQTTEQTTTPATEQTEVQPETNTVGMPNPMVAVASLDELNEKLGCNLVHPGVMGITGEAFYVIADTLGQYDFTVNGTSYTFRFSDAEDDISGIYTGGSTLLDGAEDGAVVFGDGFRGARWFTEEGQYCLTSEGDIDDTVFAGIVEELIAIQNMNNGAPDVAELPSEVPGWDPEGQFFQSWYDNLAGDWQDMTSGRAMMTIESKNDHAFVTVSWADSAFVVYEWTMNITMGDEEADGTNHLNYTDCSQRKVESDGTTDTVTIIYDNGEGYFTLNQGGFLLWDGAADESCQECMFEQVTSATPAAN